MVPLHAWTPGGPVLETVVHCFYGKHWEKLIPLLQSRTVKREKKADELPTTG